MSSISWREKHARGTMSALISCIVHTGLLIALALTYVAVQEPPPQSLILQAALAGAEEVSLDFSEQPKLDAPKSTELSAPAPAANTDFDLNLQSEMTAHTKSFDATLTAALADVGKSGGSGGVSGGGGGAGDQLSKLGANFFGSYAAGEKFVFVLDSSTSMAGERWQYACQELMDSVAGLEPNQKFFVICFDKETTCMFNTPMSRIKFEENNSEIRAKLKRWLTLRKLGPGTLPGRAMTLALGMHPDAIFMLSDGELRDGTVNLLRELNGFSTERPQVPIHTVHLMSLDGRQSLQVIASENAGTFTPIQGASF